MKGTIQTAEFERETVLARARSLPVVMIQSKLPTCGSRAKKQSPTTLASVMEST